MCHISPLPMGEGSIRCTKAVTDTGEGKRHIIYKIYMYCVKIFL